MARKHSRADTSAAKVNSPFSPEILDEIGKCFARAAVDAFLADEAKTAGTHDSDGGFIPFQTETDHAYDTDESAATQ